MKTLGTGLLLWFAASAVVAAEGAADCVAIEDPAERLACFDRQFKEAPPVQATDPEVAPADTPAEVDADPMDAAKTAEGMEKPAETVTSELVEETIAPAAVAAEAAEPAQAPTADAEPASEKASDRSGFFGDEKVDMDATITTVYHREQQKMVFVLDNEQVWMQSSPRLLRIREGDRVNIRNASVGGYMLRTQGGVTTRVDRVR